MAQQPQDIKASLSTPRTPAQPTTPTTPTTQATQTTTMPTTPVAASTEATQKKTIVVDTAPTPSETKVDNTIKYSFDDNTNTYLKTVKYLVDNFSGKVIPLETVGMSMTMNAWQAVKNIIIKTKDENFTSVMDELNKIIISGTGTDKCFADNRIFYYSNSFLASGRISKEDIRAYELMISTVTILANKATRKLALRQVVPEEAFKYLRSPDAVQRLIQYYTS